MIQMSEEEYQKLLKQMGRSVPAAVCKATHNKQASKKPSKHHNIHVYVYEDGFVSNEKISGHGKVTISFDSIKEYNRWNDLTLLQRAGAITNLKRQVPFLLQAGFTDRQGKAHRASYYRADFVYERDGQFVVEDVKAFDREHGKFLTTQTFNLKWKILQAKYPDYTFQLF